MDITVRVSDKVQNIAADIGTYYLRKNNNDYKKAEEEIQSLRIGGIKFEDGFVHIYLARPGLIIGRKGSNLDALGLFLKKTVRIYECQDYTYLCTPMDLIAWEESEGLR